jgi:signal peptidase I
MTASMKKMLRRVPGVIKIVIEPAELVMPYELKGNVFPLGYGYKYGWDRDNFGPIYIPKKGTTLALNSYNLPIYERIIRVYENNKLEVVNGKFFINGEETNHYTFKMDYYWMMGDNRHNSADSRFWGFVPEDHVVGRPVLVWLSLDKDKTLMEGKIRFDRFFLDASR